MMPFARCLAVVSLIVLAGCQYDPYTSVYTRKQPKVEDLIGVYVPDEDTKRLILKEGHYPDVEMSITLESDKRLTVYNLPDWWRYPVGKSQGGLDWYSGTWDIEKHQEYWVIGVMLTGASATTSHPFPSGEFATDLLLTGEKAPYKIHIILGDPDEGRGMDFVRKDGEKK